MQHLKIYGLAEYHRLKNIKATHFFYAKIQRRETQRKYNKLNNFRVNPLFGVFRVQITKRKF